MFHTGWHFVHCCMVHADMYESYREGACWDVVKAPPQGTVLNIVRAANSDRYDQLSICKPVWFFTTCMNLTSIHNHRSLDTLDELQVFLS